ncbi:MAG TPA: transporter substrate-binding domain-containing protein [Rhodocyclaceae bacterium]|nr:transporter substrate-binding domain-containing protein [Rhodocyclaceae bacterium]
MLALRPLWLLLIPAAACAGIPNEIPVCDIGGAWPPYAYNIYINSQETDAVAGFSVDYIRTILARHQRTAHIELIPWRRCQKGVAAGNYAMLLNASLNPEREKTYLVSKPYYVVHDVYFYARSRLAPRISNLADLKKLRLCGQEGYNYANFGLRDEEVETGATSFPQAMNKLLAGRCDVVLGRREIAAGFRLLNGIDYTRSPDFGMGEIPGMQPASFHMMISRNLPYGEELLHLVNQGIDEMKQSGEEHTLARRYLPADDKLATRAKRRHSRQQL